MVAVVLAPAAPASAAATTARPLLFKLPVASEAGAASYDREKFPHWIDGDSDS